MSTTTTPETAGDTAVTSAVTSKPSFGDIPLGCIRASKTNPRKRFDQVDLDDLAKSIKVQGVAQPILVRPVETVGDITYFEIVAGERRFRASGIAGMTTVPAIVRELSDQAAYEIQVLENLQRVDLHPLEEAEGFEVMMTTYKDTAEQLAEKVGKSKAYIYASLKLCALVPAARTAFYDGLLTKSTALLVARIPVKDLQVKCTKEIAASFAEVYSTRAAAEHIARNYMLNLTKATFNPEDLDLCKKAGPCSACPKRAGNQPIIFADVAADVCTDPVCFKAKSDAHGARVKQIAIASGKNVISGVDAKKIMPYHHSHGLQAGYVNLDAKNYDDDKNRTYRQILGKDNASVALLESPHDGSLHEVVKVADIKPLLVEKGVGTRRLEESAASKAREKAQEAKAKLEREYRTQLFTEIHHSTLMMNLVDLDLRLVARQLFDRLPSGTISKGLVISLTGWTEATLAWPDAPAKLRTAIDALTPAQLNQFIRDCVLSCELDVNTYTSTGKDEPKNLLAFAARAKVDAKKIRDVIDAEAKAKADTKKKAADKKAAKTAPAPPKAPVAKKVAAKKPPAKVAKAKAPAAVTVATPTPKTPPRTASLAEWPFPTEAVKASGAPVAAPPKPAADTPAWPFPTSSGAALAPTDRIK